MDIFNDHEVVGWCEHHEDSVTLGTFEYKGCWNCWRYFRWDDPLLTVEKAARKYKVSKQTIYRWIKAGRLKARLFIRIRSSFSLGPVKFWAIAEEQSATEERAQTGRK